MTEDVQTVRGVQGYHREVPVFLDGPTQVLEPAIEPDRHRRLGQPGPDRLRDLGAGDTVGVLDDHSIWVTKL